MRARYASFAWFLAAVISCGTSGGQGDVAQGNAVPPMGTAHPGASDDVAPANLVINGDYSDERFLDMMAAHHQMAVEMGKVTKAKADHAELRKMASDIIASQSAEIEAMRGVKQDRFATSQVTLTMNPDAMQNDGFPEQIADAQPFDLAFLDAMIPHHAGAIRMASVARMRSSDARVRALSRSIIDAQSKEIGTMIAWRNAWYPDAQ